MLTLLLACYLIRVGHACAAHHVDLTEEPVRSVFVDAWQQWKEIFTPMDLRRLERAVEFAARKHEGQYRKDTPHTPYVIHPIRVAHTLFRYADVRSIDILSAALLHDTLEDSQTSFVELEEEFNFPIAFVVRELTQPNKEKQLLHAPFLSASARIIKLSDRLDNIRDLRLHPPYSWSRQRILRYCEWGDKLNDILHKTAHPILEHMLTAELGYCFGFDVENSTTCPVLV